MSEENATPRRRDRLLRLIRSHDFTRDIMVTTLGVLIALGLGAIASEIGWKIAAAQAREALGDELGEIVGQANERESADPCIERKLDEIAAIIDQAAASHRLPPVGAIGDPLYRTWSSGVWASTINADISSHMDRETLDNLSGVYEFVATMNSATRDELVAWTELTAIVGPGRPITDDEIRMLRASLSRARIANRMSQISAIHIDQIVKAFELPANSETIAEYAALSRDRFCRPIAAPAGERYGAAPYTGIGAKVRANPVTRDDVGKERR